MPRLIDADKLKAHYAWWGECSEMAKKNKEVFDTIIDLQPTADVVERKKGKWKPFDRTWGRSIYYCTACGEAEDCPTEMGKVIWRFCPNCGAEMERNEDEQIH